ncbi:MAG: PAS domain S-box protein [Nakamurella sp.]
MSWSDYVHQIFGTDPAGPPPTYDVYVSMVHPDDRERVLSVIRTATMTRARYEVDHRIVRRDGEVREIRGSGRADVDASGQPVRLTGGLQDVTEMRAAARELSRSRDLFSGVLDAATEQSIIATDPDGLVTVFNTGAERMLGYTAQEMIGTSPERLHDAGEIRDRAVELAMEPGFGVFLAKAATGQPETRRWTYITRDGRRLLASITVTAMRGSRGEVSGFIKVGTDITERVQAQTALQESASRLRTMDHAPIGLAVMSQDLRFLEVNPAFCAIAGYRSEQLLQSTVADITDPIYSKADAVAMVSLLRGDLPTYTTDVRIHASDGSLRWVSLSASTLRGPDGSPSQYIVQIKDIAERKQAEKELLDKTRRLRNAEKVGRSGSWELDIATGTLTWSDGLFDVYGIERETFGHDYEAVAQFLHPEDRAPIRALFDACAGSGVSYTIRYRLTRPSDGAVRWCEERAERLIEDGQPVRVGGSVVDVTELVLAENEIHSAYAFQQALMGASPDVIFAHKLAERSVVWSNHSLAGLLGFPDQAGGHAARAGDGGGVLPPLGAREFEAALLTALNTAREEPTQLDLRLTDANGEHRWFSLRTTPLHRDARGVVTELMGILRDITVSRQAEAALRSAQEAEKTAMVAARDAALAATEKQSNFAASAAHELRTPTTAVLGFVEEVLDNDALAEDDRKYLEMAYRNALRLGALIDDLLIVGEADIGSPRMSVVATPLSALVDSVVCSFSAAAQRAQVALSIEFAAAANHDFGEDPLCAMVDPSRLEQALTNLVSNAVKFTPAGGQVRVISKAVDDEVHIAVQDTGIGIDAAGLEHIFDRFYRTKQAVDVGIKGTGLGLAIARQMVETQGGRLTVTSVIGEGATFTMTLPAAHR